MLQLDELSTSSIEVLRRALEDAEILLPAQEQLSRPANVGYVLEGLSHHPKAKKLVLNTPNGAATIDFQQITVKELRPLAKHMKAHKPEDRKAAIIASIIERLQGEPNMLQPSDNDQASKTAAQDLSSKADVITKTRTQGSSGAASNRISTPHLTLPPREALASRQQRSGYSTAASMSDGFQGPAESLVTAWDRLTQQQSSDNGTPVRQWTGQTQGQLGDSPIPVRQWAGQTPEQLYDSDSLRQRAGQLQGQSCDGDTSAKQWTGQTQGRLDDSETPVRQWTEQTQGQSHDSHTPVRQQTAQTLALPLPHRDRDRGTNLLRKLFGPAWHREVVPEARLQGADSSSADPEAKHKVLKSEIEQQRATLEHQWLQAENRSIEKAALQADPWSSPEVMQLIKDVQRLHCKGKGQSAPGCGVCLQRLKVFAERIQGFERYKNEPAEIIAKGSRVFGNRNGFVVLLRGPEQYLTKGPGHMYIYYSGDVPNEYKVGVCEERPSRRLATGKLVGRFVDQCNRNHKEYILKESFAVPHRTLVDQVLKIRLKQWNFCQDTKGDGYTEWFRDISFDDLRDHVRDVARLVKTLYPES